MAADSGCRVSQYLNTVTLREDPASGMRTCRVAASALGGWPTVAAVFLEEVCLLALTEDLQ